VFFISNSIVRARLAAGCAPVRQRNLAGNQHPGAQIPFFRGAIPPEVLALNPHDAIEEGERVRAQPAKPMK